MRTTVDRGLTPDQLMAGLRKDALDGTLDEKAPAKTRKRKGKATTTTTTKGKANGQKQAGKLAPQRRATDEVNKGKAAGRKAAPKSEPVKKQRAPKEDINATVANIPASAVELRTNIAPSVEIATELQHAWDYFNNSLFEGKLEPVVFSNCRLKKALGYFWPKQWARRAELKGMVHEIGLDFARLHNSSDKDVLATLVHEMCHQLIEQIGKAPKRPYHCKYWVAAMLMVGLEPVILDAKGQPTGKATGPNSGHKIIAGEKFDTMADELLASGFSFSWKSEEVIEPPKKERKKKKAGAKAKHTCPECQSNAWGKPSLHLLCAEGHDPVEMVCPDREEYEGEQGEGE